MKLRDLYARPGLTFSIEFFPPKTPEGDAALFREVEILKTLNPAFCSVTYGPSHHHPHPLNIQLNRCGL
ncbi:MAG: hypothetical protein DMG11_12995 [Acidobacteria bacterium]|nr:MAG: hypothetical protein DMG11_12995 [Acidobacteriota bacterium]